MAQGLRIHLVMREHWLDPWSRKIPHAMGQQSLCATATEPALRAREPDPLSLCAVTTEARPSRARAPQREKPPP